MATTRFITNSAAATAAIIGLLGVLAKRLGIPWVGDAVAFVVKVPGVEINWDFLWLVLLVGSGVVLIGMNFSAAKRWINERLEKMKRYWNMNLCDAITYVGYLSHFGKAWPENTKQVVAAKAIYEAAKKGQIEIAGVPLGSMLLAKIPKSHFDGQRNLDLKHCNNSERNIFLFESDKKTISFSGLIADRRQIENVWPPKPQSLY
jgi:hypothetical protein